MSLQALTEGLNRRNREPRPYYLWDCIFNHIAGSNLSQNENTG